MTELAAALETIQPELMTVTRLFGLPESVWQEPVRYRFEAEEADGTYRITFTDGERTRTNAVPVLDEEDSRLQDLHRRRAARRLCKQTLYDFCRERTGIHPPWGSLTGVRPTHLMLEALGEGLSPAAAMERLVLTFYTDEENNASP